MNTKTKDLNYYMGLDYTMEIKHVIDENGSYYYGKIIELDGCHTTAETPAEVIAELEEVKRDYLEIKLEYSDPIPEPNDIPSGKFVVRMPRTLHWKLAAEAEREGVSLNQYMVYKLSKGK